jgi:prepilin-type N-terminal cleavage/methylation domain-containing protein/prepilin-type processing-associated H-X9-DG protein
MQSVRRLHAFSLVELLIVIAIIASLIGILLPVISRVRESGRSTVCLANLQQWGYIYQAYLSANHGKSLPEWEYPLWQTPWQALEPYGKSSTASLLCPSANEPKLWKLPPVDQSGEAGIRGSASHAWYRQNQLGTAVGSNGFNYALYDISARHSPPSQPLFFHFPAKEATQIPVFADCIFPVITPGGDQPPTNLESSEVSSGIGDCCIDRHRMSVNVAFLDGHGEHMRLPALYGLRWNIAYVPHSVVIPGS